MKVGDKFRSFQRARRNKKIEEKCSKSSRYSVRNVTVTTRLFPI